MHMAVKDVIERLCLRKQTGLKPIQNAVFIANFIIFKQTVKFNKYSINYIIVQASRVDYLGATLFALGSGGFNQGYRLWAPGRSGHLPRASERLAP